MKKNLLVISSYPPKGITHDKKVVGVATYAKNTIHGIEKQSKDIDITVLAEKLNDERNYKEGRTSVKRIWTRKSFLSYFILLKEIFIRQQDKKTILLEFELAMFNGMISLILLPIFISILRLLGKELTISLHQVITDIKEVHGHINIKRRGIKTEIYNILIQLFYISILKTVSKVIVFDEVLKERLTKLSESSRKKISVIPHGVEKFESKLTKEGARRRLGISQNEFVILYFGFIAWYKGTDELIDSYQPKSGQKLIIAGGANPNHYDKMHYLAYLKSVEKKAKEKNIEVTGFVPEEKIAEYFLACDVVIFPYRTIISASGPLSMAFSFEKPFAISSDLKEILKTADFNEAMKEEDLSEKDIIYIDETDLEKKISSLKNLERIKRLSENLAKKRSWDHIGKLYYNTI